MRKYWDCILSFASKLYIVPAQKKIYIIKEILISEVVTVLQYVTLFLILIQNRLQSASFSKYAASVISTPFKHPDDITRCCLTVMQPSLIKDA